METDFKQVRRPAVAGAFYTGDPARLAAQVRKFLGDGGASPAAADAAVRALIVPHAGYEYSGAVAGKAYALLRSPQAQARIRRVVVAAPTHCIPFRGVSLGNYGAFATPLGEMPVDAEACRALAGAHPLISTRADAHSREHALEVQLPFLQTVLPQAKLVPLVCGELSAADARTLAPLLRKTLWNTETLWVISSDFTHFGASFGYVPFTRDVPQRLSELDHGAVERICAGDLDGFAEYLERTGATICGAHPISLLLAVIENAGRKNGKTEEARDDRTPQATDHGPQTTDHFVIREVAYTTSGQLTGDWEHTVSYAAIAVEEKQGEKKLEKEKLGAGGNEPECAVSATEKRTLLKLAREAIRTRLKREPPPAPEELTPLLQNDGACFITLHIGGELRGCIGYLEAVEPLWRNVVRNARAAAFNDPRFFPLSSAEFEAVDLEISVLTPFRPIPGPDAFVVGRHGIILEKGGNHAVFLPQVAPEQGWDRETTLTHLALKAGLPPDGWRRGAKFSVFEAIAFGEKE
jgi:AmmeMemoRadiSam system protein B/AmmeMemoRadiSam system protein A